LAGRNTQFIIVKIGMSRLKIYFLSTFLVILIFSTSISFVFSQKRIAIDSLTKLLNTTNDSSKVNLLKQISWEYRNLDTSYALSYGKEALKLAKDLNLSYEKADILGRLGIIKRNQGDYSEALDYYFKGLEISQKHSYLNLQALGYNNIADIYSRLGIYDKALEYVNNGELISRKLNDKYTLAYILNIKGIIFKNLDILDSALFCFRRSLDLRKEIRFLSGVATSYLNIGLIHELKGDFDSSLIYFNRSLDGYTKMDDQTGIANSYKCLGSYYNHKGDFPKAIFYFEKSLDLIKKFGDLHIQKDAAEGIKYSYSKLGNIKKAFFYQEFASKIKDSLANYVYVEKITQLTENFKFEIRRQEQDIIRKQNEEVLNQKINFQRSQLNLFIVVFVIMVIFIGIIVYFYRDKNKAYQALNQKNIEIEILNSGLIAANNEIKSQKEEIEAQRDILQEQHDKLELLNSTKDKLFSIIAHDLRSPFNSIIGFSEMLKLNLHSSNIEEIEEMVDHINIVGNNTFKLLDNLLNWAKAQTHQVVIHIEKIKVDSIIEEVVNSYKPLAIGKNIYLYYQGRIEIEVNTDKNVLNTIFRNLISNALKYTKPGGTIKIVSSNNPESIEISIEDNGVGMTEEVKNNLFKSNVNPSAFGTANEKGTGLGLVICKEFVHKLNGEIWVESKLGIGSSFKFTIPIG